MAWTTPRTWVSGEVVTAALLNAQLRDNLNAIADPWAAYTPVWTASTTNPVLGNGTITGKFLQVGHLVLFEIHLTIGSTTTFGSGRYDYTLPSAPNNVNYDPIGRATVRDVSANLTYPRDVVLFNGSRCHLCDQAGVVGAANAPVVLATGDLLNIAGMYEAA